MRLAASGTSGRVRGRAFPTRELLLAVQLGQARRSRLKSCSMGCGPPLSSRSSLEARASSLLTEESEQGRLVPSGAPSSLTSLYTASNSSTKPETTARSPGPTRGGRLSGCSWQRTWGRVKNPKFCILIPGLLFQYFGQNPSFPQPPPRPSLEA